MKKLSKFTAAVLAGSIVMAPQVFAQDRAQLVAAAGLTQSEAEGMSLTEIHAHKINREGGRDNQVTVSQRNASAGVSSDDRQLIAASGLDAARAQGATLSEIALAKYNKNASRENRIPVVRGEAGTFDPQAHPQLLSAAGLSADEAEGLSLNDIAVLKYNREAARDDQQRFVR